MITAYFYFTTFTTYVSVAYITITFDQSYGYLFYTNTVYQIVYLRCETKVLV